MKLNFAFILVLLSIFVFVSADDDQERCKEEGNVAGRCLGFFENYYYDVEKDDCIKFVYGGCGGNRNRFETKEECEQICKKSKE